MVHRRRLYLAHAYTDQQPKTGKAWHHLKLGCRSTNIYTHYKSTSMPQSTYRRHVVKQMMVPHAFEMDMECNVANVFVKWHAMLQFFVT